MTINKVPRSFVFDSNMFVIVGKDKTALIDTGFAVTYDYTLAAIKDILDGKKLDYIIITHRHQDHIAGLSRMLKDFPGVKAYAGHRDIEVIRSGGDQMPEGYAERYKNIAEELNSLHEGVKFDMRELIKPVKDISPLYEGDKFDLEGHVLEIIETPGHTVGAICILDSVTKSIFTGDSFHVRNLGVTHHPTGSEEDIVNSANKLLNYDFVSLHPGHGDSIEVNGKDCLRYGLFFNKHKGMKM